MAYDGGSGANGLSVGRLATQYVASAPVGRRFMMSMGPHDYFMPRAKSIEEGFLDDVHHRSFGDTSAPAGYFRRDKKSVSAPEMSGYAGHWPHTCDELIWDAT